MGSFMIQSLVGAVVLNRPMQRWGLLPNRTQGLHPYRGSNFPVGPQASGAMAAAIPAQSLSMPEAVVWMRGGRSEGAKYPRDPLPVREAQKLNLAVGPF